MPRYEIRDSDSGEVLSSPHTKNAALDVWRLRHAGAQVKIVRVRSSGTENVLVEGVWHGERHRSPRTTAPSDGAPDPAEDDAREPEAPELPPADPDQGGRAHGRPMNLHEVLDRVVDTVEADWHPVPALPSPGTPVFEVTRPGPDGTSTTNILAPRYNAVLKEAPEISMAWGRERAPDPELELVDHARGRRISFHAADVMLGGSVVHREPYVVVDGAYRSVRRATASDRDLGTADLGTAELGTAELGTADLGTADLGDAASSAKPVDEWLDTFLALLSTLAERPAHPPS